MTNDRDNDRSGKGDYGFGMAVFGGSIVVAVMFPGRWAMEIEQKRDVADSLGLWALEWLFILVGVAIPWLVWKKFVKPVSD